MVKGVMVVINEDTNEMLTMAMDNVTVDATEYAAIAAGGDDCTGSIAVTFSKSSDRYNRVKATPTYTEA